MPKAEVRAQAERLGLAVADKPDSQDICFVPSGSYARVVEALSPGAAEPGDIVDLDGRVLGRHPGIIHYTIGQRRGLGVSGSAEPLYVVDLDARAQKVVVGSHQALARDRVHVSQVNWLDAPPAGEAGRAVQIKLRSAQAPAPARVFAGPDGTAEIVLEDPQHGIAPGQAAVFYDGSRLIGGGWITGAALAQAA
jgi:tRNA-specific 2-thiouridylase